MNLLLNLGTNYAGLNSARRITDIAPLVLIEVIFSW